MGISPSLYYRQQIQYLSITKILKINNHFVKFAFHFFFIKYIIYETGIRE